MNQTEIKAGNWDYIKDEMTQIVAACHEKDVTCKVIFENCYLNDNENMALQYQKVKEELESKNADYRGLYTKKK